MPTIKEGQLKFIFPSHWLASKFDRWIFYVNQFQSICGGAKAIDILAIHPTFCLWNIEVKDYRQHCRTKAIDLADEVAEKARDTLSGLVAANANANDPTEKDQAMKALGCLKLRVVLHLEQPAKHSKLFPRAIDPAKVQQRLRQIIKAIDPHPLVLEIGRMNGVAWTVQ